jgi:hypothetical protein
LLGQKPEYLELIAKLLSFDGNAPLDSAMPHFHVKKSTGLSGQHEIERLVKHLGDLWGPIQEGLTAKDIHKIMSSA